MPRSLALLLTAVFVAAAGCAPTRPPAVSVTDARVLASTEAGVRMAVDLLLENPNGFPLPLERVSYRVSVPGTGLAAYAGDDLPARTVPAHGVQTVTLTAALAAGGAREGKGLAEGLADGLAEGLAGVLGAEAGPPDQAWAPGATAGRLWRVQGEMTYAADRGLRTFLTETGVPLPRAGFRGEGHLNPTP